MDKYGLREKHFTTSLTITWT